MRKVRIYQTGIYESGETLTLSPEASHHVGTVLRMQEGASLTLFKGDEKEYQAEIIVLRKKAVEVKIISELSKTVESPVQIQLAQAISKGDRMLFVMQKATELGVSSIQPLISERSVVRLDKERMTKKLEQWQAIVIAACEQSGRTKVPEVLEPMALEAYARENQSSIKIVLDPSASEPLDLKNVQDISLAIGPEGGFSAQELDLLQRQGFLSLSLGPRILRTETAALAALTILQVHAGDL